MNLTQVKHIVQNYLLVFFVFTHLLNGQTQKDQLIFKEKSIAALRSLVEKQSNDSSKIAIIKSYIKESRKQFDTLSAIDGYYFLSSINPPQNLQYADSIILYSKNKGYKNYPAMGYLLQGNAKYNEGNYKETLDLYIKASQAAKKNNNNYLYLSLKFNIGLLKNTAGEREEAKKIFLEYVAFLDQNNRYKSPEAYNKGLFAIADSYIHMKNRKLDSAKIYIDKGIKETLKTKDTSAYSLILVTAGIHQYFSTRYKNAIDSLEKGKKIIQKKDPIQVRVATCDYYIARSYYDLGDIEKGIEHFEKVDHILKNTKTVIPELLDSYNYLIAFHKSKQDYQQQLKYINTLLRLDSIHDSNQLYLTKNINERYDTIELISEKEELIEQLQEDSFLKKDTITILFFLLIVLIIVIVYSFRKSYINKKRFLKILESQQQKEPAVLKTEEPLSFKKKEELDIPKDVVESILKKLIEFEASHNYAKKHHTLNSLSKELNTNSAYLSKVINAHKNVNFSNYLNNLRIDYAIQQLTDHKSLRSYTIQAIAEEVGFKNAQSFSSAFHKKTGIYPSYFIKRIDSKNIKTT